MVEKRIKFTKFRFQNNSCICKLLVVWKLNEKKYEKQDLFTSAAEILQQLQYFQNNDFILLPQKCDGLDVTTYTSNRIRLHTHSFSLFFLYLG